MASPTLDETPDADDRRTERDAQILPFPSAPQRRPDADEVPAHLLRTVIGQVLRDERFDQERTLADVADEANISLPYLSEVERGIKEVSSDLLDAICDALELPLVDVLERSAGRLRSGSVGGSGMRMLAA